jgi:hypothetical protein
MHTREAVQAVSRALYALPVNTCHFDTGETSHHLHMCLLGLLPSAASQILKTPHHAKFMLLMLLLQIQAACLWIPIEGRLQ